MDLLIFDPFTWIILLVEPLIELVFYGSRLVLSCMCSDEYMLTWMYMLCV
jgi:hypothetical protein